MLAAVLGHVFSMHVESRLALMHDLSGRMSLREPAGESEEEEEEDNGDDMDPF